MPTPLDRRSFLAGAAACAVAQTARAEREDTSQQTDGGQPADLARVVVGVMGLSRGKALATEFARQPNVLVKYVCDVDARSAAACAAQLNKEFPSTANAIGDFHRILDDQEVDVLVCAAPNHWHAPATILACAAGKHVYVEKPCSHNPREGELMVAAARKHDRRVQMGTQRRSSKGTIEAVRRLHEGVIGRVYLVRSWYNALRESIGRSQPSAAPDYLDYELWQGPAPRRPFKDNVVPYNWHWNWHWGNGELGNNGVHTLDLCRWGLGVDFPTFVNSSGGRYRYNDDQLTPDTHTVSFEFDGGRAITWQGLSCNQHGDGFVTFYGEDGALDLQANGAFTVYDGQDNMTYRHPADDGGQQDHVRNFLAAIREGVALNAEIAEGHKSTLLCHLGNIAYRVGRSLRCRPSDGRVTDDDAAMELWQREYQPGWEPSV